MCKHPEIARIDYLLVSASGEPGSGRRSLGQKFGLCPDSLYHHAQHHISVEYRKAVLAGPFRSEDDLRQLMAEEGVGVLQNFRGLFNAHRARWLVALESGDDAVMINHGKAMSEMLWKIGKLTQEVAPPQTFVQNNTVQIFEHPEYLNAITALTAALRPFPEARQAVAAALRSLSAKPVAPLIEAEPTS